MSTTIASASIYDTVPLSQTWCKAVKEYAQALMTPVSEHAFLNEGIFDQICAAWRTLDIIDPKGAASVKQRMDTWIEKHYDWSYVYSYRGANASDDRTLYLEGREHERAFEWLVEREQLAVEDWDYDDAFEGWVHRFSDLAWKWHGTRWIEYVYDDPIDSYTRI